MVFVEGQLVQRWGKFIHPGTQIHLGWRWANLGRDPNEFDLELRQFTSP